MSKLTLAVGPEMDRGGRKVRPVVVLEMDEALRGVGRLMSGSQPLSSCEFPASTPGILYLRGTRDDRDEWAAFVPVEDWPAVEKSVVAFGGRVEGPYDLRDSCPCLGCAALRRGIALADGNAPEGVSVAKREHGGDFAAGLDKPPRCRYAAAVYAWPTCSVTGKPVGLAYLDMGDRVMALWVCQDCVKQG